MKHILLIEDEGEMCLLLNLILDDPDMNISHVKNLSSAHDFLQKNQPSLILLDNRLPDGYGLDFIGYIKENCPDTKVIMMSGVDASAADVALETGADAFLRKPFRKAELLSSINSVLTAN
ncbi:MAG TPA: response regulator [Puia sp.]